MTRVYKNINYVIKVSLSRNVASEDKGDYVPGLKILSYFNKLYPI